MKCSDCSATIKPIVVFDIDGTLGGYYKHFQKFAWDYHNLPHLQGNWNGEGEWEDWMGLTKQEYREAKLAYRQGGGKRFMPVYDYASMLTEKMRRVGAEIWLATTRPWMRYDSTDPDTRHWLTKNVILFDHIVYDDHKYSRLYELVDEGRVVIIVDDLPEMFDEAEKFFPGRPVQIERFHNNNDAGVRHPRVATLAAVCRLALERIDKWKQAQ